MRKKHFGSTFTSIVISWGDTAPLSSSLPEQSWVARVEGRNNASGVPVDDEFGAAPAFQSSAAKAQSLAIRVNRSLPRGEVP
jgi:hypothetical protein